MQIHDQLYCLTFDYPPMHGGVARYLSSLAKASKGQMKVLVPLDHPGRDSSAASNSAPPLEKGGQTIAISPPSPRGEVKGGSIRFWWPFWPKWLPLVKRCLELKDGKILVSHVVPIGTAAWISKLLGGPDYVVLFHGTDLQRMRSRWKRWLLRRICLRAQLLIANSEATKIALKRLVPKARALVLTPGVETDSRMSLRPSFGGNVELRKRFGIEGDTKVVLTVCRLVERKGVDALLQAISELLFKSYRLPSIELVVVGNGPYAAQLHQLADLLKVKVRWIENATDEGVSEWYEAADIFCLPSREVADDVEGFGMVFLEAAAHSLPVIAGRGWGTEEAVVDGVTGLLVKPDAESVAKALKELLTDELLCRKLGEAGYERVKKDFKWEDRWHTLADSLNNECQMPNGKYQELSANIAVVIPCYNHARELEAALESLSRQTVQAREIIVVDNKSDDDPKSVVEKYKNRLPVIYIRYDVKQGAPAARNKGASLTSAPFLLFMDADVQLQPDALQLMSETLNAHPEAAFAYSDFYWGRKLFKGREWDPNALQKMNWINTSSMIRREAWVPFDEALNKFQDWDLWLTLAKRGARGVWIPEALMTVTEVGTRKANISHWLPAFVHKMPWPIFGWMPREIVSYRNAEAVIRKKHNL